MNTRSQALQKMIVDKQLIVSYSINKKSYRFYLFLGQITQSISLDNVAIFAQ